MMIFLSHNFKDKAVVEPIAIKLRDVFGQANVFYDSWSIQPGDGIIDKMNEGLENCDFFIFFVSNNSLVSSMVKLEWQNAIYKKAKKGIKFIPVKLDSCVMPSILQQDLYIDFASSGIEVAARQLIDIIQGNNTFKPQFEKYTNLLAKVKGDGEKIEIEIGVKSYLEPISRFIILLSNDPEKIRINLLSDSLYQKGNQKDLKLNNGTIHNGIYLSVERGIAINFPLRIELSSDEKINLTGILHATSEKEYSAIEVKKCS